MALRENDVFDAIVAVVVVVVVFAEQGGEYVVSDRRGTLGRFLRIFA